MAQQPTLVSLLNSVLILHGYMCILPVFIVALLEFFLFRLSDWLRSLAGKKENLEEGKNAEEAENEIGGLSISFLFAWGAHGRRYTYTLWS